MSKIKKAMKVFLNLFLPSFNRLPFNNCIRKRGGLKIAYAKARLTKCKIENHGKRNKIIFLGACKLKRCHFLIYGNDNEIIVGDKVYANETLFRVEDDNGVIQVGNRTVIIGPTNLTSIEGRSLHVGEDCLFAAETVILTGDGHSVTDLEWQRINPSKDVVVGNHVWLGHRVTVQKGVSIADNCIVGTNAVVTKSFKTPNCAIAGIPAKITKEKVNWDAKRI